MADLLVYLCGTVCRRTGTAGIGTVALTDKESILMERGEYVGSISRNEASYLALIKALEKAALWSFGGIDINTDNELMYKQIKGTFDVRDKKLKMLHQRALNLLEMNPAIKLGLVEREANQQAYELARNAADPDEISAYNITEASQVSPLRWKVIAFTPKLMIVEFIYPKGTIIPMHRHFHEQASYVIKGKIKYNVADRDIIMTKGMGLAINGYSDHSIEALADSKEIVSYYPMRFDLLPKKKTTSQEEDPTELDVQTILFG